MNQYIRYLRAICEQRQYDQRFPIHSFLKLLLGANTQQTFVPEEATTSTVADYLASVRVIGEKHGHRHPQKRLDAILQDSLDSPQITLLRGLPNPEALQTIGAKYALKLDTILSHCWFLGENPPLHLYPTLLSRETQPIILRTISLARCSRPLFGTLQTSSTFQA